MISLSLYVFFYFGSDHPNYKLGTSFINKIKKYYTRHAVFYIQCEKEKNIKKFAEREKIDFNNYLQKINSYFDYEKVEKSIILSIEAFSNQLMNYEKIWYNYDNCVIEDIFDNIKIYLINITKYYLLNN